MHEMKAFFLERILREASDGMEIGAIKANGEKGSGATEWKQFALMPPPGSDQTCSSAFPFSGPQFKPHIDTRNGKKALNFALPTNKKLAFTRSDRVRLGLASVSQTATAPRICGPIICLLRRQLCAPKPWTTDCLLEA